MVIPGEVSAALAAIAGGGRGRDLESEQLEFKSQGRSRDDAVANVAEAAACFANAGGGAVVVGVTDGGRGASAIVGTDLDVVTTRRRIFEVTDPPLTVGVDSFEYDGTRLLLVTVPTSADVHAVHGRSTERIGDTCQPMSTSRIAAVVSERRGRDWSNEDSDRPVESVDPVAIELARSLLGRAGRRRGGGSELDLLRTLGVVTARRTLTHAGALLFCADRGPEITYVYRRTAAGSLVVNEPLQRPLLRGLERLFDLIEARSDRTAVNVPGGQQLQLADLPSAAVREAIVNAVMHRDHRRREAVHVEHTATRLVVTSPGSFVSGITVSNVLTTSPRSRNPLLANAVRMLGLAETAGTGVDRMYAEMTKVGHQPPSFEGDENQVRVTLLGGAPNAHIARFTATLPIEESDDADTMLTLFTLLSRRTTTAAQIAPLLQKSEAEAHGVLERLSADPVRLLERTRQSARRSKPTYRLREDAVAALGPAIVYRRRVPDEIDRKVIGLVRESTTVNARMVKLLFDLDTPAASRVLADLVEREILRKTSQAQRGPSVTYGPGPRFPKPSGRSSRTASDEGRRT